MLDSLRRRLSYANVAATLALFVALGGTSYAALTITGKNIKNSSLTGADIKNSSLKTSDIKNNSLKTSDIKNSSLLAQDFKAGQLPAGPKGATGAPGAPGGAANVITRTSTVSAPVGVNDFSVPCQAGEKAVGGGATGPSADPEVTVAGTFPSPATNGTTPTGWTGRYNVTGIAHNVTTSVVCASP
jgi:hypothetical protein